MDDVQDAALEAPAEVRTASLEHGCVPLLATGVVCPVQHSPVIHTKCSQPDSTARGRTQTRCTHVGQSQTIQLQAWVTAACGDRSPYAT